MANLVGKHARDIDELMVESRVRIESLAETYAGHGV
jgi:hypothetical protein